MQRVGFAIVRSADMAELEWIHRETVRVPLPPQPLCDDVACLRPLHASDAAAMAAAAADPTIVHFALWPSPFTEADARLWIEKQETARRAGQGLSLAILDAKTRRFCGVAGIDRPCPGRLAAEQYLWLGPEARGKRMAVNATLLLDRWVFQSTQISRMEAVTLAENASAIKNLERIGYTREGELRGGLVHYGGRHDAVLFSLLRSDLEPEEPAVSTPSETERR